MERVRLVDWLKSERDQHVGGGLYYNSQIQFAYNSNHMEGVVPEKLRTLDRGRPWRDSQFASTRLSPSRDMSR